jgi:hypothetical protein
MQFRKITTNPDTSGEVCASMRVMNAIGYAPPTLPRHPRRRLHRIEIVTLASSVSIVALLLATALHLLAGVDEGPLVVGTILVASIAGWINAYLPATVAAPGDGGQALDDDLGPDRGWYDRAA